MFCNENSGSSSLKLDQYGNLLFVTKDEKSIMKISNIDLEIVFNLP